MFIESSEGALMLAVTTRKSSIFGEWLRSLALPVFCSVLFTMMGCKPAPTTNTVVSRATSPDGKSTAILVDRYYQAALVADEFFLIVIPSSQNADEAINARKIGDSAVLVATWASKVQVRWQSNRELLVLCNSCGLRAIDISKKLDHVGSVKINYQGFPEHTAYR